MNMLYVFYHLASYWFNGVLVEGREAFYRPFRIPNAKKVEVMLMVAFFAWIWRVELKNIRDACNSVFFKWTHKSTQFDFSDGVRQT